MPDSDSFPERIREKIRRQLAVERAYISYITAQRTTFQIDAVWDSEPNTLPGAIDSVRTAIDTVIDNVYTSDPITSVLKYQSDSSYLKGEKHVSEAALIEFAKGQDHIKWTPESLAIIEAGVADTTRRTTQYDWVAFAWNKHLLTKTPFEKSLTSDMLKIRTFNPYYLMLFVYTHFTKSDSILYFFKAFLAQTGVFGAAYLHVLHTTIEYGLHYSHTYPSFSISMNRSDWCLPLGSGVVEAFYDHVPGETCKDRHHCVCNNFSHSDGPKYTHADAYSIAFVPENVFYDALEYSIENVFLKPKCDCKFVLKAPGSKHPVKDQESVSSAAASSETVAEETL